jgi:hypothetical protein
MQTHLKYDRAFHPRVAEQALNRSEIAGLPVDERGLGPPCRLRFLPLGPACDRRIRLQDLAVSSYRDPDRMPGAALLAAGAN